MYDSVTPELIEEITAEMIAQAEAAGAAKNLDIFVSSYRKLTNLKRLRVDIEEYRLSIGKFLNTKKPVVYVNSNIRSDNTTVPMPKYFSFATPEQELILYWLKTEVLDKPIITLAKVIDAWASWIVVRNSWRHWLKYLTSQKYRLRVKSEAVSVLSFSFRSAAMAEYILSLRAVCRQSREEIILSFVGRGVIIPGNVNAHLTLRDCISKIYLEQKAMARIAIKHHKKVLEGINRAATEPLPDHVAEEFPKDELYPEPEYQRNADDENDFDGELPDEPEEEETRPRGQE